MLYFYTRYFICASYFWLSFYIIIILVKHNISKLKPEVTFAFLCAPIHALNNSHFYAFASETIFATLNFSFYKRNDSIFHPLYKEATVTLQIVRAITSTK